MNKSKSPSLENSTSANRNWHDTTWTTFCATRIVPPSQQCFPNLDLRISHHKAHRAHWITGWDLLEFITLWKTAECSGKRGRRLQLVLLDSHETTMPQRGEASTARAGIRWDLQAIADCLQKEDKRVECLQAVDSSFEKAKSRFDMFPTAGAHWALWVDCMRELAQTFFSVHRTPKRDDAQKATVGIESQTGF